MKRINSISIKNFKFVKDEITFDLFKRNAVFYGQNGSGKSSIFWALYTFFESGFKQKKDVQKYFDKDHDENLLNRFMNEDDESYIKVTFADDDSTLTEKMISYDIINTRCDMIKEARLSSDFINYRFLSRMYDFRNSEEIDIFPVLSMDILDYALEDGHNLGELWRSIKDGLGYKDNKRYNMKSPEYIEYNDNVLLFNELFDRFLQKLALEANDIIKEGFKEEIKLAIMVQKAEWNYFISGQSNSRSYKLRQPVVNLRLRYLPSEEGESELKRPHTYLNEGRLNITFLALRLALFRLKLKSQEFQLMVLDDLLLSLDMNYRMDVLDLLFKEFRDYQMIIFTHDLGFFNLLKTYYDNPDWIHYKLTSDNTRFTFKEHKNYMEQAKHFLATGDYEICAQLLRKELERKMKIYFQRGFKSFEESREGLKKDLSALKTKTREQNYVHFVDIVYCDNLNANEILQLKKIQLEPNSFDERKNRQLMLFNSEIISLISRIKAEDKSIMKSVRDVNRIIDRLHGGAHDTINFPQFKKELELAIATISKLGDTIFNSCAEHVNKEVKRISNKKADKVVPAVSEMLDNIIETYLNIDYKVEDIQNKIVDLAINMGAKKLQASLGYLYNNRLDELREIDNNDFICRLIDECDEDKDKMKAIGDFAADIRNESININDRVFRKLDTQNMYLLEEQQSDGWSKYVYKEKLPF